MTVKKDANGSWRGTEVVIHTQPVGFWIASANAKHLEPEEPADMLGILKREGLWS